MELKFEDLFDEEILRRAHQYYSQDFEENSKEDYEKRILRTIERAMGRTEFIAYHKVNKFLERMYVFMQEAEDLIEQEEYRLSFWIVTLILKKIPDLDIDDHDGNMFPMAKDCVEIIEKIWQKCRDENIKNEIFDWLNEAIKNNILRDFSVVIEEMFQRYFL